MAPREIDKLTHPPHAKAGWEGVCDRKSESGEEGGIKTITGLETGYKIENKHSNEQLMDEEDRDRRSWSGGLGGRRGSETVQYLTFRRVGKSRTWETFARHVPRRHTPSSPTLGPTPAVGWTDVERNRKRRDRRHGVTESVLGTTTEV